MDLGEKSSHWMEGVRCGGLIEGVVERSLA